jgi:hypothetical protein
MTRLRPDAKAVLVNDLPRAGKKPQKVISLAELLENLHLNACRSAFGEAIPHSQPGSADHFNAEGPAFARAIRQRAPIHQEEHSLTRGASGLIQKSPSGACLINARPTCRESCGTPLQSVSLRFVALGNVLLVGRHGLVRLAARYPPES